MNHSLEIKIKEREVYFEQQLFSINEKSTSKCENMIEEYETKIEELEKENEYHKEKLGEIEEVLKRTKEELQILEKRDS